MVIAAAVWGLASACANQSLPPGGPPDGAAPLILSISPDTNSVGGVPRALELRFDEVISESPRTGGTTLGELVFISPKSGDPQVNWGRRRITIRPSRGWKPNTVYSVQIKPGIQDLRNNAIDTIIRVVFSTGGAIPDTRITGVAFDWFAGKGMASAVVEAVARDSTVYQAVSDSSGRFQLRNLPSGPYLLRAYADRNNNRDLDPLEIWDSTQVTLTQEAQAEFYAFAHDTVGLRITEVAVQDTNRVLKVVFDKPYPNDFPFQPGMIVVTRADSSRVQVRGVQTALQKLITDSVAAKQRADSLERIAEAKLDTSQAARAKRDSVAQTRRRDSVLAAQRLVQERQRQLAQAARAQGRRLPPIDTTPPPKMSRQRVYNEIFVTLDSALPWQSQFRVQTTNVRSLSGTVKSPARNFATPRAPRVDSANAGRDTSTRTPAARGGTATPRPRPDTLRRDHSLRWER